MDENRPIAEKNVNMSNAFTRAAHGLLLAEKRAIARSCAPSFKRSLDGSRIAQQAMAERPSVSAPVNPHQRFPQRLT
jgi:hypothetical protein